MTLLLTLPAIGATAATAQPSEPDPSAAAEQDLKRNSSGKVTVRRDERGIAHFVGTERGKPVRRSGDVDATASTERKAEAHLKRYGALWALDKKGVAVQARRAHRGVGNQSVVRFQQTIAGFPVFGGELAVAVDGAGNLQSVSGETTPLGLPSESLTVSAAEARQTATRLAARIHKVDAGTLRAGDAEAYAFDPTLVGPAVDSALSPVWTIEVTGPAHIRHLVLVDRASGKVELHFNRVAHAERVVCDRKNTRDTTTSSGDPTLAACMTSGAAHTETGPASSVAEVNAAFDYVGDIAELFWHDLGVDLTALIGYSAGDGKKLRTTVRYCLPSKWDPQCPMDNAFWNGNGVYLGTDFGFADDVVAHEVAHGVTEKTSNLAYWYQSGAINESMSDVFGELVDLTNGHDKGVAQPWLLGEDAPGGAVRSMSNPPAYGDPDRMTSADYDAPTWIDGSFDNGGVHGNSGVGNKAVYLIAEPGSRIFNGQTIIGLDYGKAAKIYYQAQQMLTSGADYLDLYNVLPQACTILAGAVGSGVEIADCGTVSKAVTATEMNLQPTSADAKAPDVAPGCADDRRRNRFTEGFEGSVINWSRTSGMWPQVTGYARSGKKSLYGKEPNRDAGQPANTYATLDKSFTIASGVQSYLEFDHQYLLAYWPGDDEYPTREYYAGGRLEYSANGSAWTNASALPWHAGGAVPRTISPYSATGQPLTKYKGFGGDSHGYTSSRVDISSLAGKSVKFRWRITADPAFFLDGWTLDDITLYECGLATPSAPAISAVGDLGKATVKWTAPWWPGDGEIRKYRVTASPGDKVYDDINPTATGQVVTGLTRGTTYTFSVQAFNDQGPGPVATKRLVGTKATLSSKTITWGSGATLTGKLTRTDTGAGLSNQTLTVQSREKGTTTWNTLKTVTTGTGGTYSFYHKPGVNWQYRVLYYSGSASYLGMYSNPASVTVKQKVTGAFSSSTVKRGTTTKFTGAVYPNHSGQKIYLQRYYSGKWNTVASTTLSSTSRYSFSVSRSGAGKYKYRTLAPGHADHATGYSPVRTLTVT